MGDFFNYAMGVYLVGLAMGSVLGLYLVVIAIGVVIERIQ